MNTKHEKKVSKQLSYALRHKPEAIDINLDKNGWCDVSELLSKLEENASLSVTMEELEYVVANNNKKRFTFNDDKTQIRANQGHSIGVDLGLEPSQPPQILYHGTTDKYIESIKKDGLKKQRRDHLHLSVDIETASNVGSRHGKPVILEIRAMEMRADGYKFYLSKNNVWLTESVPVKYINF